MIKAIDLAPGKTFCYENNIYITLSMLANKTAMAKMVCKTKVRNLRTGAITELSFSGDDKFEEARLEKKEMQYLYKDGSDLVFMDNETFDQVYINEERLKWELNFIVENQNVEITYYQEEILGIALPAKVDLVVTKTEPGVRGDTATKATKEAVLETGYITRVPLFINEGDKITVRTEDGSYDSRA